MTTIANRIHELVIAFHGMIQAVKELTAEIKEIKELIKGGYCQ